MASTSPGEAPGQCEPDGTSRLQVALRGNVAALAWGRGRGRGLLGEARSELPGVFVHGQAAVHVSGSSADLAAH